MLKKLGNRKKVMCILTTAFLSCGLFALSGCSSDNTSKSSETQVSDDFIEKDKTINHSDDESWDASDNAAIENLIQNFSQSIAQEEDLQKYFALDEMIEGFDLDYASSRVGLPKDQVDAPTIESREVDILKEIKKIPFGLSFRYNENNEAIQDENAIDYKNLKLIRIDQPAPKMYNSEQNQETFKKQAKTYGADTFLNRTAMYEINGQYYICPFTLIKYNNAIKIYSLNIDSIDVSMVGPLLNVEEYVDIIQDRGVWADK